MQPLIFIKNTTASSSILKLSSIHNTMKEGRVLHIKHKAERTKHLCVPDLYITVTI